jgi:DNA-binding NarL/FixJ family response regulator
MKRVIVCDDHKILVDGLVKLINASDFLEVIGIAYTANECSHLLEYSQPDVLMLDINLPDADGIEYCKELITKYPNLNILALTSYGEYSVVKRMLENGAKGYVIKNSMPEELIEGLLAVSTGETFLCHEVEILVKSSAENSLWLTPREHELLKLIVEGYTYIEIADKLFLSPETIKSYRKNLCFKLGAKNTAVLVKIAIENKLI